MRYLVTAAAAALALHALPARAELGSGTTPRLTLALGATQRPAFSATLLERGPAREIGAGLRLASDLDVTEAERLAGSGAGAERPEPVLAFILGFFPGFGLGHWYAGDPNFVTWTIIDIAILAAAIVFSAVTFGGWWIIWIAWIAERVFEGISAYNFAAGRTGARRIGMARLEERENGPPAGAPSILSFAF